MDINELTIGQAKELAGMFGGTQPASTLNSMIGQKVIVRTYSAGNWFGTLAEKAGNEVILSGARRMWKWRAAQSISLSACALYGVITKDSKIVEPVPRVWLEAVEIILCSPDAIDILEGAPHVAAE